MSMFPRRPQLVQDPRADVVAGLRALADLVEQNQDLPVPKVQAEIRGTAGEATDDQLHDRITALAVRLGVPARLDSSAMFAHAQRSFGPVDLLLLTTFSEPRVRIRQHSVSA